MAKHKDEMDLSDLAPPPGMPPATPAASSRPSPSRTRRERRGSQARGGEATPISSGALGEIPTENPYAGDRRVPMNHRVLESIPARVAALSEELVDAGYAARQVSQAELIQAVLHFHTPSSVDEARILVQRWALLKGAPPVKR